MASFPWSTEIDRFLAYALASQLLSSEKLAEAMRGFQARGSQSASDATLADLCAYLSSEEILTQWQCDKLRAGKFKGFFLDGYKFLGHLATQERYSEYLAEEVQSGRRVMLMLTAPQFSKSSDIEYRVVDPNEGFASDIPDV